MTRYLLWALIIAEVSGFALCVIHREKLLAVVIYGVLVITYIAVQELYRETMRLRMRGDEVNRK